MASFMSTSSIALLSIFIGFQLLIVSFSNARNDEKLFKHEFENFINFLNFITNRLLFLTPHLCITSFPSKWWRKSMPELNYRYNGCGVYTQCGGWEKQIILTIVRVIYTKIPYSIQHNHLPLLFTLDERLRLPNRIHSFITEKHPG